MTWGFIMQIAVVDALEQGSTTLRIYILVWPDRYAEFEDMEERFRTKFDLDVSMMKKDGGPFTLKQLREGT
jgi:uncharacterized protein YbjT (DUF2867 family)